jgi:hypothetical protein
MEHRSISVDSLSSSDSSSSDDSTDVSLIHSSSESSDSSSSDDSPQGRHRKNKKKYHSIGFRNILHNVASSFDSMSRFFTCRKYGKFT